MLETMPLRHVADVRVSNVDKKSVDGEAAVRLCNYTDVYYSNEIRDNRDFMAATATRSQIERFRLAVGDTIVTKDSETADDIAVPAYVAETADDLVCGYHLAMLRPRVERVEPRFLAWAIRSDFCKEQFSVAATGVTRYGLKYEAMLGVSVPIPPVDAQRRIADFLDDQVSRIDEAVRLRREQIESLHAAHEGRIRLAVGGAALTDAPTDSSVPWIGAVHPRASVQPLRRCLTLQRGVDLTADERREGDNPVVTTAGVVGTHDRAVVEGPGVVIGRYGTVGNVFYLTQPFWPHNTTLYVKDFKGNEPRYAYWLLRAFPYDMQQARAAVPGVNRNDIHPVHMPYLPRDMQNAAVDWIDADQARTTSLTSEMTAQIALLEERKRSLITSAVTGEFDVTTASGRGI